MNEKDNNHKTVMVREVLSALHIKNPARGALQRVAGRQARYIDATVGLGGHAIEIVKSGGNVLGIEADSESLEIARERLIEACPDRHHTVSVPDGYRMVPVPTPSPTRGAYTLVHGNFKDLKKIALEKGFDQVDGILFDLGISSYQLTKKIKGFSFQDSTVPLDMRLDSVNQKVTASDLLKALNIGQLTQVFKETLTQDRAKVLAKKIIDVREKKEIKTVGDFLMVIGDDYKIKPKLHGATLPFLALRIAVNSELDNLRQALPQVLELLVSGGRLVVISFHSGEDRLTKHFFKVIEDSGRALIISKKAIIPGTEEIKENPRARSAKMRILQKK